MNQRKAHQSREFLAAHALREPILAPPAAASAPPTIDGATERFSRSGLPLVSLEGYARFEARAWRRRIDRCLADARDAIRARRLKDAASALDEIIELGPNLPEIAELTAALVAQRWAATRSHRRPWIVAVVTVAIVTLGASWVQDSSALLSYPISAAAMELVTPTPHPTLDSTPVVDEPVAVPAVDSQNDSARAAR